MPRKSKRKSCWEMDPEKVAAAEAVLRESKKILRDPGRLMRALAEGDTLRLPRRSAMGVIAGLYEAIRRGDYGQSPIRHDPEVLDRLLSFYRDRTDLLTDPEAPSYATAALALAAHHRDWVRPLDDWRRPSHNALRQFRSLLRHLLARYEVPTFLDAAWTAGLTPESVRHQGWYKHVGSGRNVRTADELPIPLTKKQAHLFLQAPDDLEITAALRWAVIVDLGGDDRLARSLLTSRIGEGFGAEEFRASVVRYFIAHPMLDPVHHGPIVDYLHYQKLVPSVVDSHTNEPGQPMVPAQPHLSLKRREPGSLLRAVANWHRSLARSSAALTFWLPSGIPSFVAIEVSDRGERRIEAVELLNSEQLDEEGRAMHHCVASYASSCAAGRSSIWSLRKRIESGRTVRLVTVEVEAKRRRIVQARGRRNRMPTQGEWGLLERWRDEGGPELPS